MDNGQLDQAEERLVRCLKAIAEILVSAEEDHLKKECLDVLCQFNYGVCLEKQGKWSTAQEIYQKIIKHNQYHLDSYCRLANIFKQFGNVSACMETFA